MTPEQLAEIEKYAHARVVIEGGRVMDWQKQAMQRAESFLHWEDGLPLHAHDARMLAQDLKDALAEVERLRAEVRKQVFGSRVVFDRDVVERAQGIENESVVDEDQP